MQDRSQTRTIAITGSNHRIERSILLVNLALELGALGSEVALIDSDINPRNSDSKSKAPRDQQLKHGAAGFRKLEDVAEYLDSNVYLLKGVAEPAGDDEVFDFPAFRMLKEIGTSVDYLLIDSAVSAENKELGVLIAADEIIFVATPEPASIIEAYALIRVALEQSESKPIWVVVNNVVGIEDAEKVFRLIEQTVENFLSQRIRFLGLIPRDPKLAEAARDETPIVHYAPECPASRAIRLIARRIQSADTEGVPPS